MSSLLDGQVYMNTLNYFNKLEDDSLRADPYEGSAWQIQMDKITLSIKPPDGNFIPIGGVTTLRYTHPDDLTPNVYCLYGVSEETEASGIDARVIEFGDTFVAILEPNLFIEKIADAAKKIGQKIDVGTVGYIDELKHNGPIGPFRKRAGYDYQSEFRILMRPGLGKPITLEIGDIREIAIWGPSESLPDRIRFNH